MTKIGFVLSHEQFPAPQLLEFGAAAEAAGFDMVWTSDHFHPWMDNQGHSGQAWITLAALGRRMPRLPFGTGVTCPTFRYRPTIVAQAFASLGVLYPGRVFLGVGSGEALNEIPAGGGWGNYQERAECLVEAVQLIRQLWSGEWVTFQGNYYQVENARIYDLPPEPIPIYIAAEGPESMRKAGRHGDGLITDSMSAMMPEMRDAFAEGARAVGRDPQAMPILAEHFVTVGGQAAAAAAAKIWRFIPKAWDTFVHNPDPRAIAQQATSDISTEQVTSNWLVSPDPDEHAESLMQLFNGGVTEVYIHSGQPDQFGVIEFYGREVLPRVRRMAG